MLRGSSLALVALTAACASIPSAPPRAPRDLATFRPTPELSLQAGHVTGVGAVAFSGDGGLVATWGGDVRIWDARLGIELRLVPGASGPPIALDRTGRVLAAGGPDQRATLYDTATGEALGELGPPPPIVALAFAGDDLVIVGGDGGGIWEPKTGARRAAFETLGRVERVEVAGELVFVAQIERAGGPRIVVGHAVADGRERHRFPASVPGAWGVDPAGTQIALAGPDGAVALHDLRSPGAPRAFGWARPVGALRPRADGMVVVTDAAGIESAVLDPATGAARPVSLGGAGGLLGVSPDGAWLVRRPDNGVTLARVDTGAIVTLAGDLRPRGRFAFGAGGLALERTLPREGAPTDFAALDFSSGRMHRLPALPSTTPVEWSWAPNQGVEAKDPKTGASLFRLERPTSLLLGVAPDGRAIVGEDGGGVELIAASGARTPLVDAATMAGRAFPIAVTPDARTAALATWNGRLLLYDVGAQKISAELPCPAFPSMEGIAFDPKGGLLAVRDDVGGYVLLYDVAARQLAARLLLFGREDWALVSADGRYDGSGEGMRKIRYVAGYDVIPGEGLFERYFTPRLAATLFGAEAPAGKPLAALEVAPPPRVKIVAPADGAEVAGEEVVVEVEVQDRGGGVEEVFVLVNGKRPEGASRGLASTGARHRFTVRVPVGRSELAAVAVDRARTESSPASVTVTRAGPPRPPRLFLLVAGVNAYKNPRYALGYARPDAEAFAGALEKHGRSIFAEIRRKTLFDAEVTRSSLEAAFAEVGAAAQPEDVFVFYFAGHGVMSEGATAPPDFFLAPHDVLKLYGDDEGLGRAGLSSRRLRELATEVRAQKQLLVFDACQSGGAVEAFAHRGAVEEKAILQLSRSAGVTVLAATGTEQLAAELAALGHGVFTYALLEGMKGGADGAPGDGRVTVRELSAFIEAQVPELTQRHRGAPQYPQSFSWGQDFPLGTR